jgi:hypothetical protein
LAEARDCAAQFQDSGLPFKVCSSSPPTILSLDTPLRKLADPPALDGPLTDLFRVLTIPAGIEVVLTVGSYGLYDPSQVAEGRASMVRGMTPAPTEPKNMAAWSIVTTSIPSLLKIGQENRPFR